MARAASYFSSDYQSARARFLSAAQAAGAMLKACQHPVSDSEGVPLTVDVAMSGPEDAGKALLTISGTHGAEGFCGSGV